MHVLHLSHTDITEDSRILKQIDCLSTEYSVSGIGILLDETTVATEGAKQFDISTVALKSKRFLKIPSFIRHICVFFEFMLSVIKLTKGSKYTVIQSHDFLVLPIAILLKVMGRTQYVVYDAHELESDRNGISKSAGFIVYFLEKVAFFFVDGFITVSASIENWYKQNFMIKESVVIYNSPITLNLDTSDQSYLRNKFAISEDLRIFIYVGILGQGRGIENIIDIFENNPDIGCLVLLGYGPLEPFVTHKSVNASNIFYHEAVVHDDVVKIVKSADFGLLLIENVSLSDYFALPNKLFEYMFAKTPIVGINFPEISKVLVETNSGVVLNESFTTKDFVKTCNQLDASSFTFDDVSLYSWNAQKTKLLAFYNSII